MRVLVDKARGRLLPLANLVQLRHQQSGRAGDIGRINPTVARSKRTYVYCDVIDNGRLQSNSPSGCVPGVRRNFDGTATRPSSKRFRNHQVDRNAFWVQPSPRLLRLDIEMKPGCPHSLLEQRLLGKDARVKGQVAILGRLRKRDRRGAGVQVDRLRPHHDHSVGVVTESFEGIQ